jgi:hypothetical protein
MSSVPTVKIAKKGGAFRRAAFLTVNESDFGDGRRFSSSEYELYDSEKRAPKKAESTKGDK